MGACRRRPGPTYSLVGPAYNEAERSPSSCAGSGRDGQARRRRRGDPRRRRQQRPHLRADAARRRAPTRASGSCGSRGTSATRSRSPPGVDVAGGDAVIVLDADLQDPPEVVARAGRTLARGVRRRLRGARRRARARRGSSARPRRCVLPRVQPDLGRRGPARRRRLPARRPARARRVLAACARATASCAACSAGSASPDRRPVHAATSASRARRSTRCARCSASRPTGMISFSAAPLRARAQPRGSSCLRCRS